MDSLLLRSIAGFRDVEISTSGSATPALQAPVDELTVGVP